MDKQKYKRYIVNGLFIFLVFALGYFCLQYYFLYKDSKMTSDSKSQTKEAELLKDQSTLNDVNDFSKDIIDTNNFEGYVNIKAVINNKESITQEIKLFLQGNNAYFFMPSYCKYKDIIIDFEEDCYELYIDECKINKGDTLSKIVKSDSKIKISSLDQEYTTMDTEYLLKIMYSEKMPTIFISTANNTMEYINDKKGNEEPGELICFNDNGEINCSGTLKKIKMHGNTSLSCMKKSYQINFEESTDFMNMGMANKWILQANSYDRSYMRNKIVYDMAKVLNMKFAIDAEYADVYFNDEYAGNYLICEKIEVGKNRVDIPDLGEINNSCNDGFAEIADIISEEKIKYYDIKNNPDDISGGYLLEINNIIKESDNSRLEEKDCYFSTDIARYEVKSPQNISKEQAYYISTYVKTIEELIKSCDTSKEYSELKKYIDIDSFVNMYIINAITNEVDTNNYSTFYYKDSDKNGGKLYAGPVWDYDRAFGNEERNVYYNLNGFDNGLCENLFKNKMFQKDTLEKFNECFNDMSSDYIDSGFEKMKNSIKSSVFMNDIRWKSDLDRLNYSYNTFADEVSYLKYYFCNRFELIKSYINKSDEYSMVEFVNGNRAIQCWIKKGEILTDEIIRTVNYMYASNFWMHKNGNRFQQGRPVLNDMVLYAGFNENSGKSKATTDEITLDNEGDSSMNWLAFIMIMTPGIIPLFISGNSSIGKISELPQLIMRYLLNSFIILMVVYGLLYLIKGSVLFSFSNIYSEDFYYTIFHVNGVFIYMLFSVITGVILGIIQRVMIKRNIKF